MIQFTSGSTRAPRGVMLTHDGLIANTEAFLEAIEITPEDRTVSWLPLYHDMGLIGTVLMCLSAGIPIFLMSPQVFLLDVKRWLWAMHRFHATITVAPNFAYQLVLNRVTDAQLEGLTGQISFDFIDAEGTLYPLECNPRATSGVHLFTPGDGLVEALLGTRDTTSRPRPETRSMLVLAMGVYALPKIRSLSGFTRWLKDVQSAKDALYRPEDPAPLWQQVKLLASLGRIAQREKVSLIEASTWDIEWNGDT